MSEKIAEYLVATLGDNFSPEVVAFIVSMLPILELRGGLVAAKLMNIDFFKAFAICFIGNLLPIPFILLFIRKVFQLLKKIPMIEQIITKLEARSLRKADNVKKYRLLGLLLFVGIPLPGTGAWTGALIADLLDIRVKHSFPTICLGVLIAGIIMSIFSYGLLGLIGF